MLPSRAPDSGAVLVEIDILARAFHLLASTSERASQGSGRQLYGDSVFARLNLASDIVDRYVEYLCRAVAVLSEKNQSTTNGTPDRPFAVVLSHDVDYLPIRRGDNCRQAVRSVGRSLLRQHDPGSALLAAARFVRSVSRGRDPYGCIPEIIAGEKARGVRSSFQVAVARRHPADVNYDIRDDTVRDYLRAITDAGFDLCLHGSYRSTEHLEWYVEEAALLGERLARPLGSRQHYLSFDYDTLFRAQEAAGIRYDMSIGYPDRCGPRAGFSFPYFPYCLEEERPYDVLEIPLFYMDVTLQSYMRLAPDAAWEVLEAGLQDLKRKGGAVSVVWHPIVFGGARDPGYDKLYWKLVERVRELGGVATDARSIHDEWRHRARSYASFAHLGA